MTEIYLIRHAQAEGNRFRIMQGHWDGGVTELGRRQIALLSDRLRDLKFDAVCSSDLYRAMLTASAVYKPRSLPLYTTPALRELNIGPWEQLFFGNLLHEEPELAHGPGQLAPGRGGDLRGVDGAGLPRAGGHRPPL